MEMDEQHARVIVMVVQGSSRRRSAGCRTLDRPSPPSPTLIRNHRDSGINGMCVGEKRKLKIPSHMGYGDAGSPPTIPGKATLIFDTVSVLF